MSLARLAHRLGGDRAGVDHDRVASRPARGGQAPASPRSRRRSAGSRWVAKTGAAVHASAARNSGERRAREDQRGRAGHPDAVVAPVESELAAVEDAPSPGAPVSPRRCRGDGRGAGARAAGQRDAGRRAPRPASADRSRGRAPATNSTLVALGEQRVVLDRGAARGEVHRLGIGDEEDAMRVAHADGARGRRRAAVASSPSPRRQRNSCPVELRRAHVDRGSARRRHRPARSSPRSVARVDAARAGLGHQQPRDAAGGVAAGGRGRAVGVEEVEPRHRRPSPRSITASWSKPTPRWRSPSARASAGVTAAPPARRSIDHEVVAEPVHFQEPEAAGLTFAGDSPSMRRYIGDGGGAARVRPARGFRA